MAPRWLRARPKLDPAPDSTRSPSRRAMLLGGAALVGGTVAAPALGASPSAGGEYIWAVNTRGVVVPPDRWVKIPWTKVYLNTTEAHVDAQGTGWVFPARMSAIYAVLCNIAWDNAMGPTGKPITPPTHRKLVRIPQQGLTGSPFNRTAITGASQDLTYHADLARRRDQSRLSDGSLGYQQQQVSIMAGWKVSQGDQRIWIEVYQDSGMPLMCRWDGTSVPAKGDRPAMIGLQAPSLMITKMCEW